MNMISYLARALARPALRSSGQRALLLCFTIATPALYLACKGAGPEKKAAGPEAVPLRTLVFKEPISGVRAVYNRGHNYSQWLALAPDTSLLALAKQYRTREEHGEAIVIVDPRTGKIAARLAKGDVDNTAIQIVFSQNGTKVAAGLNRHEYAAGSGLTRLVLWDLAKGKAIVPECPLEGEMPSGDSQFAFSLDGKVLLGRTYFPKKPFVSNDTTQLVVWDSGTGKLIRRFGSKKRKMDESHWRVTAWHLCDDKRHIVVAEAKAESTGNRDMRLAVDWRMHVWDFSTGEFRGQLGAGSRALYPRPGDDEGKHYPKLQLAGALGDGLFHLRFSLHGRIMAFPRLPAGALEVRGHPSDAYGGIARLIVSDRVTGEELAKITDGVVDQMYLQSALSEDSNLLVALGAGKGKPGMSFWDLSAIRKHAARELPDLPVADWNAHYEKMSDVAPLTAFKAMRRLAASPKQTLAILKERLQPVKLDKIDFPALIADLDGPFAKRDRAEKALLGAGDEAMPFLQKALKGKQPLEARRRSEAILKQLKEAPFADVPTRRLLWSIELLEFLGTPDAKQLLERLAEGTPTAWVTIEAKLSLERLKK